MAKSSIASSSIKLSADNANVGPGLDRADAQLKQFAQSVASTLKNMSKQNGGDPFKGVGAAAKGGTSGLKGLGMAAGVGLIAGLAAGVASEGTKVIGDAVGGIVKAGMDRIPELAKNGTTAESFGLDVESWSRMAGSVQSTGGKVKEFIESMVTLNQLGEDAAKGTEGAAKAFQDLGLDAKKFNDLPINEKYDAMQDSLAKVTDASKRLGIAGKAYGTDGMKEMLPLIGKTAAETKAMGERYVKTGEDIAVAERASKSMAAAQGAVENAFDRVLIALSPVFEFVADLIPPALEYLTDAFSGFGINVVPVIQNVVKYLGRVVDGLKIIGSVGAMVTSDLIFAFGAVVGAFEGTIEGVISAFSTVFKEIKKLTDQIPKQLKALNPNLMIIDNIDSDFFDKMAKDVKNWSFNLDGASRAVEKLGDKWLKSGLNGESEASFGAWIDKWTSDRNKAIADRAKQLNTKVKTTPESVPEKYSGNQAVISGSVEAVSAQIRAEVGAADKEALKVAKDIRAGINKLNEAMKGLGGAPIFALR